MKKNTIISLVCAGVLAAGTFTGITGYANTEDASQKTSEYQLLATAKIDPVKEITATGTITGVTDVATAVMPAVVSITNKSVQEVADLFGMYGWYGFGSGNGRGRTYQYETESCGSGIIIGQNAEELLICTNYHVVEDANEITVGFIDDEVYPASVKGTDSSNDLAVVAVKLEDISEDTMSQIKIAEVYDSDELQIGQQVVAIGNALGYGQSVTTGIVSALNRTLNLSGYENAQLIQTDAAINPGNSGGPLLDMNGRVIGINSAKAAKSGVEGMGYAIPISCVKDTIEDMMNREIRTELVDEADACFIGIVGQNVSDEMASLYGIPKGIYLTEVTENGPAAKAGLQKGDIIVKFDGTSVSTMADLKDMLGYYAAGEKVNIVISSAQDGEYEEETIEVTLGSVADYQATT